MRLDDSLAAEHPEKYRLLCAGDTLESAANALAAVSVFFETLTMMSSGALLAVAIMAVWFHKQGPQSGLLFWAALATMGSG